MHLYNNDVVLTPSTNTDEVTYTRSGESLTNVLYDLGKNGPFIPIKLKIAQWNAGHFAMGGLNPNISESNSESKSLEYRQFINDIGADIVCVSEYDPYFDVANNLAKDKVFPMYRDFNIGKKNSYHCEAIFNNFFGNVVRKFTLDSPQSQITVVEIFGEEVYIVATHFVFDPNPEIESGENKAAFEALASYLSDKKYVILCGDFNAKKDTYWDIFKNAGFTLANHGVLGAIKTEPDSCITHTTGNVDNICVKGFTINKIWWEKSGDTETEFKLSDHGIFTAEIIMQKTFAIEFDDNETEKVFVDNWDSNNDGDITYDEIAAITDITDQFKNNTEIIKLNELGLTAATLTSSGNFTGMTNLEGIIFPPTVKTLASKFKDLPNLRYVISLQGNGNNNLIEDGAFWNLPSLELVDHPKRSKSVGGYFGYYQCKSANIVIRNETDVVLISSMPFKTVPKNVFVPENLVEQYKVADRWSDISSHIHPIGGEEWVAEFGSTDEWADYQKYGVYKYKNL